MSVLYCNAAEKYIEDENEECSRLPMQRTLCSGKDLSSPPANEEHFLRTTQNLQVNQILTSRQPNLEDTGIVNVPRFVGRVTSEGSSTSGCREEMFDDVKDFPTLHQSVFPHSSGIVQELQVKTLSAEIRTPNSQANVLKKHHLVLINTSADSRESGNMENVPRAGKVFSNQHQSELPHLTKVAQSYEFNEELINDTVQLNREPALVNSPNFIGSSTSEDSATSGVRENSLVDVNDFSYMHQSDYQHSSKMDHGFQINEELSVEIENPNRQANIIKEPQLVMINTSLGSSRNGSSENGEDFSNQLQNVVSHSDGVEILKIKEEPNETSDIDKHFDVPSTSQGSSVNGNLENTLGGPEVMHSAVSGGRYQCNVCGAWFGFPCRLTRHLRFHKGEKPYKCGLCDKKFRRKSELRMHDLHHKGLLPQCRVCGGRFVSLSAHMLTHATDNFNHVCSVCKKAFRRAGKLKTHMLIHSGEKPYTCADCGRQFRCSSNLKTHMKVHTNEKNHVCTVCGKLFAESCSLTTHMRTHSGEKPYCCETCGKAFSQKCGLDTHRLTHTSEKSFSCSTCGKQFRRDCALRRHKLIHTGEQPYGCSVCGMKFNQSCSMKRHMLVHTGEKPYSCSDCGERFTQSGGLASHRRRHCPKTKD